MAAEFDHLLLIGFGAPERPEDVRPFLENVTRGIPIPPARLQEVEHHYEAIGGSSPYNDQVRALLETLRAKLRQQSIHLPLYLGMRNWHPLMKDTMKEIHNRGHERGIGIILAPHRSDASFEKYVRCVEEAKKGTGASPDYDYLKSWHEHPDFIGAQAEELRKIYSSEADAYVIFTAHSIPKTMAEKSKYAEEFIASSKLVAEAAACRKWGIAYQSRSGSLRDPWLEPEVCSVIQQASARGVKRVVLVPVGFLCENAEILYDLDIEARETARRCGIEYARAGTVMGNSRFSDMLAELVRDYLECCGCS
jgi:protoporphyrin/coproporphyrin ferrochelatase